MHNGISIFLTEKKRREHVGSTDMHPTSNKHGPGSHFSMELYGSIFTSVHFIIIESSGVWLQSSCWMVQTFTHVQDVFYLFFRSLTWNSELEFKSLCFRWGKIRKKVGRGSETSCVAGPGMQDTMRHLEIIWNHNIKDSTVLVRFQLEVQTQVGSNWQIQQIRVHLDVGYAFFICPFSCQCPVVVEKIHAYITDIWHLTAGVIARHRQHLCSTLETLCNIGVTWYYYVLLGWEMFRSSAHLLQRVSSLGDTHGRSMPAKVVKVHEDIVSSYQW